MKNDSSIIDGDALIIDVDALALENVTGGLHIVGDPGGQQTSLTAPGGVSLTCPPGTAPHHTSISGTGTFSEGPIHVGGKITWNDDRCDKLTK